MRFSTSLTIVLLAALLPQLTPAAEVSAPTSSSSRPRVNALAAIEFPHVLTGEVDLQISPRWAIGINGGGFAYTLNSSTTAIPLTMAAGDLKIRFHPFKGAFFVAMTAGYQRATAGANTSFSVTDPNTSQTFSVPTSVNLTLNSPYYTLGGGWLWVLKSGFSFGLDGGFQIPSRSNSNLDVEIQNAQYNQYLSLVKATAPYQKLQTDIQSAADTLGNKTIPYAAIRFGWTF